MVIVLAVLILMSSEKIDPERAVSPSTFNVSTAAPLAPIVPFISPLSVSKVTIPTPDEDVTLVAKVALSLNTNVSDALARLIVDPPDVVASPVDPSIVTVDPPEIAIVLNTESAPIVVVAEIVTVSAFRPAAKVVVPETVKLPTSAAVVPIVPV
jgi:hypothetical protein